MRQRTNPRQHGGHGLQDLRELAVSGIATCIA
jgi:hypothetical protein